jgi:hypothetical protein
MTSEELERAICKLQDRQEILDCITAYCRGVDRMDRDLLLSTYHPDAIDDHGQIVGSREAFVDWLFDLTSRNHVATTHIIANHYCTIEGDIAHAETYYIAAPMRKVEPQLMLSGGRYIDRLERRNGKWAIAVRKVVKDWWGQPGDSAKSGVPPEIVNQSAPPSRDRSDPSYQRPLSVSDERLKQRAPPKPC